MSTLDLLFLSFALAMDSFTVSIASGVIVRQFSWKVFFRMSLIFGLFQGSMPFWGWLGMKYFNEYLEAVDHWIAFILLIFIGGKMLKESFEHKGNQHFNPEKLITQCFLAIATSIDALAIGISFACIGYKDVGQLVTPLLMIGIVSFLMSLFGNALGIKFGEKIARKCRPERAGGIILILIGAKILIEHLSGIGI
ncbi:MAG: manganese efflux pump MntP family protein [Prevotella sp.]|nr:manganese efflux pump MntP family protein [Prevotella sp.]